MRILQRDDLVRDIEAALRSGDRALRSDLVMRLADHLVGRWSRLPSEDKPHFDALLSGLLGLADGPAQRLFAERLAPLRRPPRLTATLLARQPDITVAAPILSETRGFDEDWLVAMARECGEPHRRMLALRRGVPPRLARALSEQGGPSVAAALLANPLAEIAPDCFPALMGHAARSESVALRLGARADLDAPSHAILLAAARERALAALRADLGEGGPRLLARADATLARMPDPSRIARFSASAAFAAEQLGPRLAAAARLERWLSLNRIEDTLAAIAWNAQMPVAPAIAAHDCDDPAALAAILRGLGHGWPLLKALLRLRHGAAIPAAALREAHALLAGIGEETARRLVRAVLLARRETAFLRSCAT